VYTSRRTGFATCGDSMRRRASRCPSASGASAGRLGRARSPVGRNKSDVALIGGDVLEGHGTGWLLARSWRRTIAVSKTGSVQDAHSSSTGPLAQFSSPAAGQRGALSDKKDTSEGAKATCTSSSSASWRWLIHLEKHPGTEGLQLWELMSPPGRDGLADYHCTSFA